MGARGRGRGGSQVGQLFSAELGLPSPPSTPRKKAPPLADAAPDRNLPGGNVSARSAQGDVATETPSNPTFKRMPELGGVQLNASQCAPPLACPTHTHTHRLHVLLPAGNRGYGAAAAAVRPNAAARSVAETPENASRFAQFACSPISSTACSPLAQPGDVGGQDANALREENAKLRAENRRLEADAKVHGIYISMTI